MSTCATLVLDRVEGDIAVLLVEGQTVELPASALPEGASEGEAFALTSLGRPSTSAAEDRLARLRQRDPGGTEFDL